MGFTDAIKTCLHKYADFNGRAALSEYWYFVLFYLLVNFAGAVMDAATSHHPIFQTLFSLALIVPHISVVARRLHDTDRSGWWYLIAFIPIIGGIALLVWLCQPSKNYNNRFGSSQLRTA
jgi:uncharacterized membrane protein YhaH (DUF805 family)